MSIDLNFWKERDGIELDSAFVYHNACCDHKEMEELEPLPVDAILNDIAAAFCDWDTLDLQNYEKAERGSFQISTTPQTIRFDCYAMDRADMKRFSPILSKYGCPLYDPQQNVRFDKIAAFLIDEAGAYKAQVEQEFARLLPHLEVVAQTTTWDESLQLSKTVRQIQYSVNIHRAKTVTKVISFLRFGSGWSNRPCQCKTAQLTDEDTSRRILEELLQKSIERAVNDFLERTYYAS